jgi:hypothetical protein
MAVARTMAGTMAYDHSGWDGACAAAAMTNVVTGKER